MFKHTKLCAYFAYFDYTTTTNFSGHKIQGNSPELRWPKTEIPIR